MVEIKRGGKIRLHWFKEARLMSGVYSGTNSYFVERASNLTPFISYAADKTTRTVALFPLVEVEDKQAASKKPSGALCCVALLFCRVVRYVWCTMCGALCVVRYVWCAV